MSEWVRDDTTGCLAHLGGIPWSDAPLPRRRHRCLPQTRGFAGGFVERCACGAIRLDGHGWMERNQTRRARKRSGRDAKASRETVTCGDCGQDYEAVRNSRQARSRQCTRCWARMIVASQGRLT